jgi:hypothetical protein
MLGFERILKKLRSRAETQEIKRYQGCGGAATKVIHTIVKRWRKTLKFWIYTAACLLVFGVVAQVLQWDGAGAAEALVGGGGALVFVLIVCAVVWLIRLPFKAPKSSVFSGGVAPTDPVERRKWQNREEPYDK